MSCSVCLICNQNISVPKDYNLKRHYSTHNDKYNVFTENIKKAKLKEVKCGLTNQKNLFTREEKQNEAAVRASFVVSNLIACHSIPFNLGPFIKMCVGKTAEIDEPENVKAFKEISLSWNTVSDKIVKLANDIHEQFLSEALNVLAYSITVDESTDINSVSYFCAWMC